jgi:nitrate/nitrite transporter NarK
LPEEAGSGQALHAGGENPLRSEAVESPRIDYEEAPFRWFHLRVALGGVPSAASNLAYVYLPELFPTALRASGIGLASAISRIGSAVSTFLLPVVVATYGVHTALAACVAVLAAGALICQAWAPETQNLRLENLDQPG